MFRAQFSKSSTSSSPTSLACVFGPGEPNVCLANMEGGGCGTISGELSATLGRNREDLGGFRLVRAGLKGLVCCVVKHVDEGMALVLIERQFLGDLLATLLGEVLCSGAMMALLCIQT